MATDVENLNAELAELKRALIDLGVLKQLRHYPFNLEAALAGANLVTRGGVDVFKFQALEDNLYLVRFGSIGVSVCDEHGKCVEGHGGENYDVFLAEPWPRQEAEPAPKLGEGWPWEPKWGDPFFRAAPSGIVARITYSNEPVDHGMAERFNVYRTEAEATARAELDKRLAIHAALRQLGGGDVGKYVVRYWRETAHWVTTPTQWFAPGEAMFMTSDAAKYALDVLLAKGILKHGVPL